MFVMDCYGHKLSNGVLFAHHLILDVPGGSSHLGYTLTSISGTKFVCLMCTLTIVSSGEKPALDI